MTAENPGWNDSADPNESRHGADEQISEADDAQVDAELQRGARDLRDSVTPADGRDIITGSLKTQLLRTRRMTLALMGLSALLAVALVGAVVVAVRNDPVGGQLTKGSGALAFGASEAAIRLVDSLPPEPVDPRKVKLVASVSRYDTCDTLTDELHKVGAEHVGSLGFGNLGYVSYSSGYGSATDMMMAADGAARSGGLDSLAFTDGGVPETQGTNVVVEGVDEPDTVKASGSLVVDLVNTTLRVTDTSIPAVVGTLKLSQPDEADLSNPYGPSSFASSMLLDGKRAVVFGSEYVPAEPLPGDPSASRPTDDYLTITFVDLADPTKPTVQDRVRIEGRLVAARRVGKQVRIVTSSDLAELPMVVPTTPNSVAPALRQNRLAVAESTAADWIPDWDYGRTTDAKPLVECGDVVVPDTFAGVQMTSLVEFDMDKSFAPNALSILAPAEAISASATDVVVSAHVWVDPANQKGDYRDWSTALHRFEFSNDGPNYVGSGVVPGSVMDTFSLSVLDDTTIGVVTVDRLPWEEREKAKVTVRTLLSKPSTRKLAQIGSLEPAAAKAGVGGVRFVGNRLLISSGLLNSELSSVDLADRSAPVDQGSVSLGGTGEYIHPLADGRVLVLGSINQEHAEFSFPGIQVVLVRFDPTPAVVTKWDDDYASTNAGYDHHAFTWWRSADTAAFGVMNTDSQEDAAARSANGEEPFGGWAPPPPDAAFIKVAGEALEPQLIRPTEADLGPKCQWGQEDTTNCDPSGPPTVSRVLVVNGDPWLYTDESLEHLDAGSLNSVGVVALRMPH